MTEHSTVPRTRRSSHFRRGDAKPTRSPTMRLLLAVDQHRPYAGASREACAAAWQRVQQQVAPGGGMDVEASFYKLVTSLRTGKVGIGTKGDDKYRLLATLSEDVFGCEVVGRSFRRPLDVEAVDDVDAADDQEEPALLPRRSTRRRQAPGDNQAGDDDNTQSDDDETAARPRRRVRKAPAAPRPDVDPSSDEQFVDLLLQHAPHFAQPGPDATAAWTRVRNALPLDNALSGRALYGLKTRSDSLERALATSATPRQREKLTPRLEAKVREYFGRRLQLTAVEDDAPPLRADVEAAAAAAVQTAAVEERAVAAPNAPSPPPPPHHDVAQNDGKSTVKPTQSVVALAIDVEKNLHREIEASHAMLQRMGEKRLAFVATLLKEVTANAHGTA